MFAIIKIKSLKKGSGLDIIIVVIKRWHNVFLFANIDTGGLNMGAVANIDVRSYAAEMEENNANVRKMVLESYQDMRDGKGRDYKEFFAELESRYKNVNV